MASVVNGFNELWTKYCAACPSGERKIWAPFLYSSLVVISGGRLKPDIEGLSASRFISSRNVDASLRPLPSTLV